jgi:hypothetical protein
LARRIAFGFADFLFAEDTEIVADATDGADQDELDHFAEINKLQAKLHRMERVNVSEGEVWWKLHTNLAVADTPLLTFNSRCDVVPLFYGDRVLAAGFVTEVGRETVEVEEGRPTQPSYSYGRQGQQNDVATEERVWRWIEIHTDGRVLNVLYQGTEGRLGERKELTARQETAGLNEELVHGQAMWAGRIVNDLDDDDALGVSEYEAVEELLLALNEALTISVENARLTGQDRIFVAGRFTQPDGSFDASLQVFQVEQEGGTLGEDGSRLPIMGIEKVYQAEPLWLHISKLVRTILTRVGLVPEFIGEDDGGQGTTTAPAMRLRLVPTTNAAKGKAREWKAELPLILQRALAIVAMPTAKGGMGRPVSSQEPPAIELADPIPQDDVSLVTNVAAAVAAEVMSRETGIGELHPDWSEEQVAEELAKIRDDQPAMPAPAPPDHPPPPAPEPMPPEPAPTGA